MWPILGRPRRLAAETVLAACGALLAVSVLGPGHVAVHGGSAQCAVCQVVLNTPATPEAAPTMPPLVPRVQALPAPPATTRHGTRRAPACRGPPCV